LWGSTTCSAVAHVATQCLPALAGVRTNAVMTAVRIKDLSFIIGYFDVYVDYHSSGKDTKYPLRLL
jgi:hypothetical protein